MNSSESPRQIRSSGLTSVEGSQWPSLYGAAPFLDIPVIARSPCDEATQGPLPGASRVAAHALSYNPAGVRQSPSGISHAPPCVYIMANDRNGTLYTGVTSNLPQRIHQHREGLGEGFTRRYQCKLLAFYETYERMDAPRNDGAADVARPTFTRHAARTRLRGLK